MAGVAQILAGRVGVPPLPGGGGGSGGGGGGGAAGGGGGGAPPAQPSSMSAKKDADDDITQADMADSDVLAGDQLWWLWRGYRLGKCRTWWWLSVAHMLYTC